jgi:Polyketide cyclase / dehydrase and lipid transport
VIWAARLIVFLIAVVGVVALVGWMLPVTHEATRSAEFTAPATEVYALVSNVRDYAAWWPDIQRIDMLVDEPGRTVFREHLSDGPLTMTVVSRTPPSQFVTKIRRYVDVRDRADDGRFAPDHHGARRNLQPDLPRTGAVRVRVHGNDRQLPRRGRAAASLSASAQVPVPTRIALTTRIALPTRVPPGLDAAGARA